MVVDTPLGWEAKTNHATPVPASGLAADGATALPPALVASAKPAETHFRRLSVSPDGLTRWGACVWSCTCVKDTACGWVGGCEQAYATCLPPVGAMRRSHTHPRTQPPSRRSRWSCHHR